MPTMRRPENLERFIKAYNDTQATLPIWVIFDAHNAFQYDGIETPKHWRRVSVPAGMRLGDIFNRVFKKYPDEKYYAMVADDIIPETKGWDLLLEEACLPDKIAWGWDSIQNEQLPVHPFIGGNLVRKLGWWAAPGLKHWYVDNVWKGLADALHCGVYRPDIRMRHCHYANGKAPFDRTYEDQPNHQTDYNNYVKFMQKDFRKVIDRVKSS